MLRTICILFITAGCLGTTVTACADSESEKNRILKARADSNEAIRKHDADGIVALFDQTYQITTGSGKLFHDSPEKEKELWTEIFAEFPDVVYVRTPSRIDVSTYLPRAAESGDWVGNWKSETGEIEVGGSYFASWLKIDGHWKIQSETFVSLYCTGDGC
jgi:hypothetical protein